MNSVQGQPALLYIDTEQDDGMEKTRGEFLSENDIHYIDIQE